ncbi:fimbrial protein [Klebsiella aerogenes]
MNNSVFCKLLAITMLFLPTLLFAANTIQMNLFGTLVAPPACTVSDGGPVVIDFGDHVGIKKIDGSNYKQTVPYSIVCENDPDNHPWVLGLTVYGNATSFDSAAVKMVIDGSTSTDLGVKLLLGGKDFTLNKRVEINQGSSPVIEAVPVKKSGSTLPEGYFHATATILADYQ